MIRLNFRGAGVALSADHAGGLFEGGFRGVLGAVAVACLAQALTVGAVARGKNVAKAVPVEPPAGIHQGCFDYGIPRSLISSKILGNGDYWRGQSAPPTWLKPPGDAAAIGHSTAKAGLISSTTAQVGQPGPHYSSFIVYGRGYSKSIVVSPPSWEFFRGQIAVVGLKHYTTVRANGAAAGTCTLAGTARFITVAAGTSVGASALAGAAIRKVLPTGTTAGASTLAGAAIRRAVATGALIGAGGITGQGKRIVWTIGTLTGAASLVEGVPTTRIFAPAWGNSSLTGDTQVSYVGQASAWSPAIVTGLGGYVRVESAETLAGTSAAFSIQGANLKAGAVVCDGTSDLAGAADSLVTGASEADGSCVAQADTCVAFVADGIVLAGDGFDLDGNPQPSSTLANAGATTDAGASAPGGSRVEGSAPTPVPASGTITGSSDILYLEVAIYDAEGLEGISATDASASLDMRVHALSVNLSYAVATANYGQGEIAGTAFAASIARGLATVAWNERPPR